MLFDIVNEGICLCSLRAVGCVLDRIQQANQENSTIYKLYHRWPLPKLSPEQGITGVAGLDQDFGTLPISDNSLMTLELDIDNESDQAT